MWLPLQLGQIYCLFVARFIAWLFLEAIKNGLSYEWCLKCFCTLKVANVETESVFAFYVCYITLVAVSQFELQSEDNYVLILKLRIRKSFTSNLVPWVDNDRIHYITTIFSECPPCLSHLKLVSLSRTVFINWMVHHYSKYKEKYSTLKK